MEADELLCPRNAREEKMGRALMLVLCSRNARPKKGRRGSGQVPFLLAERAR